MTDPQGRQISLIERVIRAWIVLTVIVTVSLFLYMLSKHYGTGMEFALIDCTESRLTSEETMRQALLLRAQSEQQRRNVAEWIVINEELAGTPQFEVMTEQYRTLTEQATREIIADNEPLGDCIARRHDEHKALFWSEFSKDTGPVLLIVSLFILVALTLLLSIYKSFVWIFK
jgi:hypothetical protein